MFLHLSVILFTGGCLTPPGQTPHPWADTTPQADTQPGQTSPRVDIPRQTPLSADPPGQTPPGQPPPNSRRLLLRTVRILLECILVWQDFCRKLPESERNWTERGPRVPGVRLPWIRQWTVQWQICIVKF